MGRITRTSSSSSSEEDGDAEWRAAINSVAAVDFGLSGSGKQSQAADSSVDNEGDEAMEEEPEKPQEPKLKLYQIKAQRMLSDMLERNLEMVSNPLSHTGDKSQSDEGVIRLFGRAPPGMASNPSDERVFPHKRPRIVPIEEMDEKSKKFKKQIRSSVVDGNDIMTAATEACRKSVARLEARETAARAAAKREEERILALKKIRGEKWLPSILKFMQGTS